MGFLASKHSLHHLSFRSLAHRKLLLFYKEAFCEPLLSGLAGLGWLVREEIISMGYWFLLLGLLLRVKGEAAD